MLKIRLSTIDNTDGLSYQISDGDILGNSVYLSLAPLVRKPDKIAEFFLVVLNGHIVPPEQWGTTELKATDDVLIAPKINSGDTIEIFKTIAVVAITAIVYAQTGGAAAGVWSALAAAGASMAATAGLNALIPPPVLTPPASDDNVNRDVTSSQMYTISGQSNRVAQYGTVPRVYGRHRIYPNIAANPYTEIESDPDTGQLVQFFYAIYDLGLGPMEVDDIRIGETPFGNYGDASYNLVDPNKPEEDEGYWDTATTSEFQIYKGEASSGAFSVILDKNLTDYPASSVEDYQAVRSCPENIDLVEQQIILTLVNASGLYAFDDRGNTYERSIVVLIEAKLVGDTTWRSISDVALSSRFEALGVRTPTSAVTNCAWAPIDVATATTQYSLVTTGALKVIVIGGGVNMGGSTIKIEPRSYGIKNGDTKIVLPYNPNISPGTMLVFGSGQEFRIIGSESIGSGFYRHTVDRPMPEIVIYKVDVVVNYWNNVAPYPPSNNLTYTRPVHSAYNFSGDGYFKISGKSTTPIYSTFKFTPKVNGNYEVRITRYSTYSDHSYTVKDNLIWTGITARFNKKAIYTDKRHVFLEVKIRATNQLSGPVQNISAVCHSVLNVWNGTDWVMSRTSNPAWVFVDLLTGEVNKRAISRNRLHTQSLLEWANFCDEIPTSPTSSYLMPRFESNFVLDFNPTLLSILNQVSGAAQASLNIIDGKYGVLIDKRKTVPVQIFTPRNSSNFVSSRNYSSRPHAVKVSFIDSESSWSVRECIVYDDGYNVSNATVFEDITSFACTNYEQAWRFGRFMLAQNRLRQETISIQVDFENLVVTRGDYVQITQDVMKVGGTAARVKSVSGNRITIDEGVETGAYSYGYTYRSVSGIYTSTLSVVSSDTFDLNGGIPSVGDLIVIGIVGEITFDCIVKSIDPSNDLTATLTLVEKADAIYDSESNIDIGNYNPAISIVQDTEYLPPGEVVGLTISNSSYVCTGSGLDYYFTLTWAAPANAASESFEIWANSGSGYAYVDSTKFTTFNYVVDSDKVGVSHSFKVLAVSATGKKLNLTEVSQVTGTANRKTTPAPDVGQFNVDITGETLQMFWTKSSDCTVGQYLIRYSPDTLTASWNGSVPLLTTNNNANLASTQARTGAYLIKAADWEGNESTNAAMAVTTIPELFGLNSIAEINDFPALTGSLVNTSVYNGNSVVLYQTSPGINVSEGYYYYSDLLNLGDIYTVRLQSKIEADGLGTKDIMGNWEYLSLVDSLLHDDFHQWDVEAQYRTTTFYNVMSEWTALDTLTQMSTGNEEIWTQWKKFLVGDGTGRVFQFRLKLISNDRGVTPRIYNGTIIADMPDRIESYNNVVSGAGACTITYSPAFKGPGTTPNVQLTVENVESGDYWSFSSKTLEGFTVTFFNSSNTPVSRTFDAVVKGYGRKATAII